MTSNRLSRVITLYTELIIPIMHIILDEPRLARAISTLGNGILALLRAIPNGVKWDERDALFEPTSANVLYMKEKFPDAIWDSSITETLFKLEQRKEEMTKAAEDKYRPMSLEEDGFVYKRQPFDHQRKAFVLGRDKIGYMYLMEPGTGKTKVTADTATYLYEQGRIQAMLVLAENGMHLNWPEELDKDFPDRLDWRHVVYKSRDIGLVKDRVPEKIEMQLDWLVEQNVLRVMCMNIEALSTTKGKEWALWFCNKQPTLTVVDESQLISVPGSIRTRNSWSVGRKSKYRRVLTGTAFAEGLERVYSQAVFTDFKILEISRYSHFKENYCILRGQWNKVAGYKNTDELAARLDPYSFSIEKADCVDLPPQTFEKVTVELSAEQIKVYKQLRDEFIVEFEGGSYVQAEIIIARLVKLQQITSGWVKADDKSIHLLNPSARLAAAVQIATQARRKVIIWCAFQNDVDLLRQALKDANINSALYYGKVKIEQCKKNLEDWRRPEGPKVFIATLKKAVRGLTLNEADTVVFYSHTWSNEARTQSLARNYRIGQDVPVTVFDILAPGTIDVKILRDVNRKRDIKELVRSPKAVLEWLDST